MSIGRRDLVLLLLGIDSEESGLGGLTRLQKYLYLIEREYDVKPTVNGFEFLPYDFGPYSSKLYDDMQFLENLGYIRSEVSGTATEEEAYEADITFDNLFGQDIEDVGSDAYEERRYILTKKGLNKMLGILEKKEYKQSMDGIRKVKSRFAGHSLHDLLHYVYTKYPETTKESMIREAVLRKQSR